MPGLDMNALRKIGFNKRQAQSLAAQFGGGGGGFKGQWAAGTYNPGDLVANGNYLWTPRVTTTQQPTTTAVVSPTWTATGASSNSGNASSLLDDNAGTYWASPNWLDGNPANAQGVTFQSAATVAFDSYLIRGTSSALVAAPKSWRTYTSADGSTWTLLDEQLNQNLTDGAYRTYPVNPIVQTQWFRVMFFAGANGKEAWVGDIKVNPVAMSSSDWRRIAALVDVS